MYGSYRPRRRWLRWFLVYAAVVLAVAVIGLVIDAAVSPGSGQPQDPSVAFPASPATVSPASSLPAGSGGRSVSGPLQVVPGSEQVNDVYLGFPHSSAGAVSAADYVVGEVFSTLDPDRAAWKRRLMAREMANPTSALDELVEKNIRPFRNEFLLPTLRELTGDKLSQRQLSLISISVMGQCHYLLQGQPIIERLNPDFKIGKEEITEIAEHVTRFSLAGIAELTRRAPRS